MIKKFQKANKTEILLSTTEGKIYAKFNKYSPEIEALIQMAVDSEKVNN